MVFTIFTNGYHAINTSKNKNGFTSGYKFISVLLFIIPMGKRFCLDSKLYAL